MKSIRQRLTYANVMVTILAFVMLCGGVSYAALHLGKNSVGSKQLKKSSVTAAKIKKGAVKGSKLDPSVLSGYVKQSDLAGLTKASLGNDAISPLPSAALSGAIYNVGPGGVDCQGANSSFPNNKEDDIDFSTIDFDTAGLAHTEPGASPHCYNGFQAPREGTYAITAWIAWDAEEGDREVTLMANRTHGKGCCDVLAISEQAANVLPTPPPRPCPRLRGSNLTTGSSSRAARTRGPHSTSSVAAFRSPGSAPSKGQPATALIRPASRLRR